MIEDPDWGDLPIKVPMCLDAKSLPAAYAARVNHMLPLFNFYIKCLYDNFALDTHFPLPDLVVPDCVQDGDFWAAGASRRLGEGEVEQLGMDWYLYAMATFAIDWEEIDHSTPLYPPEYQGNDTALLPAPRGFTERYEWDATPKATGVSRILTAVNELLEENGVGDHVFTSSGIGDGSFFEGDYKHCPKYLNRLWAVLSILVDSFALDFFGPAFGGSDHCLVEVDYHSQWGEGIGAESHFGGIHWHDTRTSCGDERQTAIDAYGTVGSLETVSHKKGWLCGVLCDDTLASETDAWGGYWNTIYFTSKVKLHGFAAAGVTLSDSVLIALLDRTNLDIDEADAVAAGDAQGDMLVIQASAGTADPIVTNLVIGDDTCPIGGWAGTTCGDQTETVSPADQEISDGGMGSLYLGGVMKGHPSISGAGPFSDNGGLGIDGPYWEYGGCTTVNTWNEDGGTASITCEVWTGGGDSYEYQPRLLVKNAAF